MKERRRVGVTTAAIATHPAACAQSQQGVVAAVIGDQRHADRQAGALARSMRELSTLTCLVIFLNDAPTAPTAAPTSTRGSSTPSPSATRRVPRS